MTRTRFTLSDLGGPLDWVALIRFVKNLDHSSALVRAAYPEKAEQFRWFSGERTAELLAELIDCVNILTWNLQTVNTPKGRSRPKKPKPYPRPGAKQDKGERVIGKDPIPVSKFDEWWEACETKEEVSKCQT